MCGEREVPIVGRGRAGVLLELQQRGALYYFILQVGQVVIPLDSVKGRAIDLDVHASLIVMVAPCASLSIMVKHSRST